ncbi:MAG: hypothetical protein V4653_06085 [Pseudomonadota bacterium]
MSQTPIPSNAPVVVSQADLAGQFIYKFEGNAVRNNVAHRICGIGQFTVDAAGQLVGSHTSSGTPLQGSVKNGVLVGTYKLKGTLLLDRGENLGDARIAFTTSNENMDGVDGRFRFAVAGTPDRLWLMSTGATIMNQPEPVNIAELVIIEAVRFPQ